MASVTLSQPVAASGPGHQGPAHLVPHRQLPLALLRRDHLLLRPPWPSVPGASSYHEALDIANSYGTAIYAADGGTVTLAGWYGG